MKLSRILCFSALLCWLALVSSSCSSDGADSRQQASIQQTAPNQEEIGEQAPGFTLTDLDGNSVEFSDYRGKVLLVDFWATWCRPCRKSIPELNQLYQQYSSDGFEVVGISLDIGGPQKVRRFAEGVGISYKVAIGSLADAKRWNAGPGIPVAFLVDREGDIVGKWVGYQNKAVLENEIRKYL